MIYIESDKMRTIFEIEPFTAPRMVKSDAWKKRDCVMRYFESRNALKLLANSKGFFLEEKYIIEFHISMPDSWSKKKKTAFHCTPHRQKPDIDNLIKAFQDSLCEDDAFINDVHAIKLWSEIGYIVVR